MTDEDTRDTDEEVAEVTGKAAMDPVRKWTLNILALCAVHDASARQCPGGAHSSRGLGYGHRSRRAQQPGGGGG